VKLFDCVSQKKCGVLGNNWENKYAEFKRCVEMPKKGNKLCNWQSNELGKGAASLNAKIRKELAENKGSSTVWSERRVKLFYCVTKEKVSRLQCVVELANATEIKEAIGKPIQISDDYAKHNVVQYLFLA